jgi:hypothetical protein
MSMRPEVHITANTLREDTTLPTRLADLLILCARIGFNP